MLKFSRIQKFVIFDQDEHSEKYETLVYLHLLHKKCCLTSCPFQGPSGEWADLLGSAGDGEQAQMAVSTGHQTAKRG